MRGQWLVAAALLAWLVLTVGPAYEFEQAAGGVLSDAKPSLVRDPTQRVEAKTTPEGAKGWVDQAGSAQVLAGGHGLDVAPDASPDGVRAETRREQDGGGKPSSAPTAASESTYQGKTARWWARRAVQARKDANARQLTIFSLKRQTRMLTQLNLDPRLAIQVVFGRHAGEALRVSYCETGGTYDTGATNGQYLGIFQMGSSERAKYGHGSTALEQARAAYRYFVASGLDWSPWECARIVGIR